MKGAHLYVVRTVSVSPIDSESVGWGGGGMKGLRGVL